MSLSKEEADRIRHDRDDLEMLKHPELWPIPGLLPVKKPGMLGDDGFGGCAVVLALRDGGILLVVGKTMFHRITREDIAGMKPTTPEQVVADGWVVD